MFSLDDLVRVIELSYMIGYNSGFNSSGVEDLDEDFRKDLSYVQKNLQDNYSIKVQ